MTRMMRGYPKKSPRIMYDQQRTEVLISTDDGNDEWDFRSGLNNLPPMNN